VEQRPVDERQQARAVPVGGRPEVLVEEAGHHHGLQHVLLLHLVGAHGGWRPGYACCSGIPDEDADGVGEVDQVSGELQSSSRCVVFQFFFFFLPLLSDTLITR